MKPLNYLRNLSLCTLICVTTATLSAHVGEHPSVHDTVAGIALRLQEAYKDNELRELTPYQIEKILTDEERTILGQEHITFRVNTPVTVHILRDRSLKSEPFWLRDQDFRLTGLVFKMGSTEIDVWEKDFEAGDIGLGVNSFGRGNHYVALIEPKSSEEPLNITNIYPGALRIDKFEKGAKPYVDSDFELEDVPEELRGLPLLRTEYESRDDARLVDVFRWTKYPAEVKPDQVILTWSDDPKTTQTIQWRTTTSVTQGLVMYQEKALYNRFTPKPLEKAEATTRALATKNIVNDPMIHLHVAKLTGLKPGTTYLYSVGDGSEENWTELSEFTTAPASTEPFTFIYMGDAQNGLDRWGTLVNNAFRERPDAAFYIMAGDLVDRGNERDNWDHFLDNASGIYDRRQLIPAIGNHENQGGHPTLYLDIFTLLENGSEEIEKERSYSYTYSNALFVVLDTNADIEAQTKWLDKTLEESKATWKFAIYHHPAYSSAPNRDNTDIRKHWVPVFDKHHVDMALQGHDHAYLRTYPMKDEKRVDSPKDGTVYVVSVSGTKMYGQDKRDYTEIGMTNTSTYQVLDLQIDGDRLVYRAYDIDGDKVDELVIEK